MFNSDRIVHLYQPILDNMFVTQTTARELVSNDRTGLGWRPKINIGELAVKLANADLDRARRELAARAPGALYPRAWSAE